MNRLVCYLGLVALVTSCSQEPRRASEPPPVDVAQTTNRVFQVRGTIVELQPAEKSVRIKHETITNYMDAMTMSFDVRDTNELAGLAPGDLVNFRMTVTETDGWIDQIKKLAGSTNVITTNTVAAKPILPKGIQILRDVDPLSVGDALPNYPFTNQLGQAINFKQYQGQALVFTFIFTRCPYPTFCPLMSNNFRSIQDLMAKLPNGPTNWHMFTITFDPEWDTPERLNAYSKGYGCDPTHWSFLTGEMIEIAALAEQVGQTFARETDGVGISHNLRTVVVDARGKIHSIIPENKWKPQELVNEILKAAKN